MICMDRFHTIYHHGNVNHFYLYVWATTITVYPSELMYFEPQLHVLGPLYVSHYQAV